MTSSTTARGKAAATEPTMGTGITKCTAPPSTLPRTAEVTPPRQARIIARVSRTFGLVIAGP